MAGTHLHSVSIGWGPREVSPKLIHPSAIRLTFRPELPRRVYSMRLSLSALFDRVFPVSDDRGVRLSAA